MNNLHSKEETIYHKTNVMFGVGPTPFILGKTLNVHLEKYSQDYSICIEELELGIYVNDSIVGDTVEETRDIKKDAIKILGEGGFEFHKWHSNAAELENDVRKVEKLPRQRKV